MSEIVRQISQAKEKGQINVYAVRYSQKEKNDNFSVSLPSNNNKTFITDFCKSVEVHKEKNVLPFNPVLAGFELNTYEYVPLGNVQKIWDEICNLVSDPINYYGKDNRNKVKNANLVICELKHEDCFYYLCAKQKQSSFRFLKGKRVFLLSDQDEMEIVKLDDVFIMSSDVDFIVDTKDNRVLLFNKNSFQDIFKYDDYQKELVRDNIQIIDTWNFLESTELIKKKSKQKNVYKRLAKVFEDREYICQIKNTSPAQLKKRLLTKSPNDFTESDFTGDCLIVTDSNIENVMKMIAKGYNYNFFSDNAE